MEQKERRAAAIVTAAGAAMLLGAVLLSPPIFQFGYDPVSPGTIGAVQILRVNINLAGEATLRNLPGIGEGKAKAIVAYREENGAFHNVDELVKVDGISQQDLETLRPYLYLEP